MVVSNYEANALMMPQRRSHRLRGFGDEFQTPYYVPPDQPPGFDTPYYVPPDQPPGFDTNYVPDPTVQPADSGSGTDWGSIVTGAMGLLGKVTDTIGRFAGGQRVNVPPGAAGYRPPGASFNAVPWIIGGVAVVGVGATVLLLRK